MCPFFGVDGLLSDILKHSFTKWWIWRKMDEFACSVYTENTDASELAHTDRHTPQINIKLEAFKHFTQFQALYQSLDSNL